MLLVGSAAVVLLAELMRVSIVLHERERQHPDIYVHGPLWNLASVFGAVTTLGLSICALQYRYDRYVEHFNYA